MSVLISGSADRTIKLWEAKNLKTNNKCFQTIIGHSGSILDMAYIQKTQILITSSTDKTMRLWRFDKARSLLQYPWFVEYQRVHELKSIHSAQMDNSVWLSCFD
jgi:WD40 repeat protein